MTFDQISSYYWLNINLKIVEMALSDLSTSLMVEEIHGTQTRPTNKIKGSPPSSLHCCHRQDPSYLFVVLVPIVLYALLCALSRGFYLPAKLY